jgi:hypothetical protein
MSHYVQLAAIFNGVTGPLDPGARRSLFEVFDSNADAGARAQLSRKSMVGQCDADTTIRRGNPVASAAYHPGPAPPNAQPPSDRRFAVGEWSWEIV